MVRITNKDQIKELKALIKCLSDDEYRDFLNYIYVQQENDRQIVLATNGSILAIYSNPDLEIEPGVYEVIKNTRSELILSQTDKHTLSEFPNWKKVIPEYDSENTMMFSNVSNNQNRTRMYSKITEKLLPNHGLSLNYFNIIPDGAYTVYFKVPNQPIQIKSVNLTLVIMPMEFDD